MRRRAPLERGAPAPPTEERPRRSDAKATALPSSDMGSSLPHQSGLCKSRNSPKRLRHANSSVQSTVFSASRNNVYVYARCVPSRKTRDCGEPPLGQRKEYANLGSGTTARHQRRFVSGRKSAERAPGRTQTNRPELPATQNTDSRLASGDQSEQPAKNTDSTSCPLYQGIAVFAISRSSVQMYKTKNIHGYAKVR